jgi:diguanylate cyclase (GGDEF)-like protein
VLGVMVIAGGPDRVWGDADLRSLASAADAASTEMRLRLANREATRVGDLVDSHNRLHELIAGGAPLGDVLGELVAGIERYEPSVMPCIVLLDRKTNTLHPGAGPSLPPHYLASIDGVVIGPNVGTCGSAAWSGDLTVTEDIAEDPRWTPVRAFAMDAGLRHCWSNPIKAHDGEVLGTLAFYGPRPRRPLPQHLSLMADGARLAGIAIERQRTMEGLVHDARHDGLTGLPNRSAIFEYLSEALDRPEQEREDAVLFVDLDGLKALNDTLGHDRADELILEIGNRLSAEVRAGEFVGRFGGDEFVVVAKGANREQAAALAARLLRAISEPMSGIEQTVITASIGIASTSGAVTDAREAIRHADSAMYAAKRGGRNGVSLFQDGKPFRSGRRASLSRELRDAEMRGEISLLFQPVFDLAGSGVVAVEALLRWHSPRLGEISPTEFMPIAEHSGAIGPLGAWVLRESCERLSRIATSLGRPIELGVNVTSRQLAMPGFAHSVFQTLAHAEFPAALLTLEISESSLISPDAVTARTFSDLESLGVRIVVDDFGSGYSSLRWLKQHRQHGIKISSEFVRGLPGDPGDHAIVAAVVAMARALDFTVTAEGVETHAQLSALRALRCERAQGPLLAGAVEADELAALLAAPSPAR